MDDEDEELTETMDNPFAWKWVGTPKGGGRQFTSTDDEGKSIGTSYVGEFSDGARDYQVDFWMKRKRAGWVNTPRGGRPVSTSNWEVHFSSRSSSVVAVSPSGRSIVRRLPGEWGSEITGTGGAGVFRVFATVGAMIADVHKREAKKNRRPALWLIWAKAAEKSRVRLYKILAKRLARELGMRVGPGHETRGELVGSKLVDPKPQQSWVSSPGRLARLADPEKILPEKPARTLAASVEKAPASALTATESLQAVRVPFGALKRS